MKWLSFPGTLALKILEQWLSTTGQVAQPGAENPFMITGGFRCSNRITIQILPVKVSITKGVSLNRLFVHKGGPKI